MPRAQILSPRTKADLKPLILIRDHPDQSPDALKCLICQGPMTQDFPYAPESLEWDHINNDPTVNELWNLQFLHRSCNQRKRDAFIKMRDHPGTLEPTELQIIRLSKLRIQVNQNWNTEFDFDKFYKKKQLEALPTRADEHVLHISHLIDISCKEILDERLDTYPSGEALSELSRYAAGRCRTKSKNKGGTSKVAAEHILDICYSENSNWTAVKEGSQWFIYRRQPTPAA